MVRRRVKVRRRVIVGREFRGEVIGCVGKVSRREFIFKFWWRGYNFVSEGVNSKVWRRLVYEYYG